MDNDIVILDSGIDETSFPLHNCFCPARCNSVPLPNDPAPSGDSDTLHQLEHSGSSVMSE